MSTNFIFLISSITSYLVRLSNEMPKNPIPICGFIYRLIFAISNFNDVVVS